MMMNILFFMILLFSVNANAANAVSFSKKEVVEEFQQTQQVKKIYVDVYIGEDMVVSGLEIIDPLKIKDEIAAWIKKYNEGRISTLSEKPPVEDVSVTLK